MCERQKHGFEFEKKMIEKYNLSKCLNYTDKYDAYLNNIPVSIKCIKNKSSICLGDYLRNKNTKQDFYLIVGFWEGNKSNIIKEIIMFIPYIDWNNLFNYKYDYEIFELLKNISNDKKDDGFWKKETSYFRKLYNSNNKITSLNFKRDHKKQKRIQCSISFKKFQIIKEKWCINEI